VKRLATIAAVCALAAPAWASDWRVDQADSSVTFETQAFGSPVNGYFENIGAEIDLDPDNPGIGGISAYVEPGTVFTGTPEADTALTGPDGFAAQSFFRATFNSTDIREAESCVVSGARCFVATGILNIRGGGRPLEVPFTLVEEGDRAIADATIVVRRSDYGIGTIEWGLAGRMTTVNIHIEADRVN